MRTQGEAQSRRNKSRAENGEGTRDWDVCGHFSSGMTVSRRLSIAFYTELLQGYDDGIAENTNDKVG